MIKYVWFTPLVLDPVFIWIMESIWTFSITTVRMTELKATSYFNSRLLSHSDYISILYVHIIFPFMPFKTIPNIWG